MKTISYETGKHKINIYRLTRGYLFLYFNRKKEKSDIVAIDFVYT